MIQPEVNYDEKNVFYIDDIISGLFEDEAVFLDEKSLDFKDCRFNKMVFAESKMIKSDFTNVIFEKCDLSNVDFTDSSIHREYLKTAR